MKKIQAFLLFAVLLLMAGMPTDAMAAKKGKAKAEPQPVVEVMDAFKQQVQADPFLSDETQTRLNNKCVEKGVQCTPAESSGWALSRFPVLLPGT